MFQQWRNFSGNMVWEKGWGGRSHAAKHKALSVGFLADGDFLHRLPLPPPLKMQRCVAVLFGLQF